MWSVYHHLASCLNTELPIQLVANAGIARYNLLVDSELPITFSYRNTLTKLPQKRLWKNGILYNQ